MTWGKNRFLHRLLNIWVLLLLQRIKPFRLDSDNPWTLMDTVANRETESNGNNDHLLNFYMIGIRLFYSWLVSVHICLWKNTHSKFACISWNCGATSQKSGSLNSCYFPNPEQLLFFPHLFPVKLTRMMVIIRRTCMAEIIAELELIVLSTIFRESHEWCSSTAGNISENHFKNHFKQVFIIIRLQMIAGWRF